MIVMMIIMILPLAGIGLFFMLPLRTALPLYLVLLAFSGYFNWIMMRSMRLRVRTGRGRMIGSMAVVIDWNGRSGRVRCGGEIWKAETKDRIGLACEDKVVIDDLSGLTLMVRPVDGAPRQVPPSK